MRVIVIGGGAAGFFAAVNIAEKNSDAQITILEKTSKLLQKVKVSGGGRCNVTNDRSKPSDLVPFYPRGNKKLHSLFKQFSTNYMVDWLLDHGVQTKTEDDLRIFPITDSSQTIIDCFLKAARKYHVKIKQNQHWTNISQQNQKWIVDTKEESFEAEKVVISTGSSQSSWNILRNLGLAITPIVPSLFTFNIKDERLANLQGISFDDVSVKITGSKLSEDGPLLITHWGLSGPAILKLSSRGAYELHDQQYQFEILINFTSYPPEEFRNGLLSYKASNPKRKVVNYPLFEIPKRFWERICDFANIDPGTPYNELSKKQINKLTEELTQGRYKVNGKSTFKEEFVTAGGVDLSEIDLDTFECKRFPGLYLAGEVLNIDALTGGFNFQACWSGGWAISESIASKP